MIDKLDLAAQLGYLRGMIGGMIIRLKNGGKLEMEDLERLQNTADKVYTMIFEKEG